MTRQLVYYTWWPVFALNEVMAMAAGLLATVLSMDRLVAVCFPLQRSRWCTVRRARWVSALVVALSSVVLVNYLLRLEVVWRWDAENVVYIPTLNYKPLGYNKGLNYFARYLLFLFKMVVPFGIVSVTNSITLVLIQRSRKFRLKATASSRRHDGGSSSESAQCLAITVGVVVGFFITQALRAGFYLDAIIFGLEHRGFFAFEVFILVGMVLAWFNTNVNFFIYAALSKTFRKQVSDAISCKSAEEKQFSVVSTILAQSTV